jgi:hypothetical protein
MQPQPVAEDNSAAAVAPAVRPAMPWRVVSVEASRGYRLRVRFVDGLEGIVDMSSPSERRVTA